MRVPQVSERIKEAPAQALRGVFAGIGQLLLVTDKLRNKAPAGAGVPRTRAPEPADPAAAPATAAAPTSAEPAAAEAAAADPAPAPAPAADVEPEAVEPEVVVVEQPAAAGAVAAEATAVAAEPAVAVVAAPVVAAPVAAAPAPAKTAPAKTAPAKTARTTARKAEKKPPARDFDKTGNVRLLAGQEDAEATAAEIPAVSAGPTSAPLPNYDELSIASLRARLRNLDVPQLKQVADYERSHAGRAEVIAMFERRVAKLEAEPQAGA